MDLLSQPQPEEFALDPPERPVMHPLARFLLATVLAIAVDWITGTSCFALFPQRPLLADALHRVTGALGLIVLFALLLEFLDHRPWPRGKRFGLYWTRERLAGQGLPLSRLARRQFFIGLALGAGTIALGVAATACLGRYHVDLVLGAHALRRSLEVFALLFAGAMLEELVFRGYPFQRLLEALGPLGAVVVLAGIFSTVHLGNPNAVGWRSWAFFNTIMIGVLLALAYLYTSSLWLPFGIHFGWNFALGFVFGLPVSGMSDFGVVIKGHVGGARWLTGGAYGFENSGLAAVLLVVLFPMVIAVGRRCRPRPEVLEHA